ncbi:NitT/TauT family transport system substrate-binding protein [Actinacidiphila yanglinensis]|uniref:NitT/TauT family transport system substrate-binding protein n=1 Tax=Actinacidiphila yanglinensis TaxID=310779 RepID=A0A1H6BAD2_9ACTN|nr:ABC transporter substrate-binding protein [Actinacidiphila yanglinensis]SEG57610.1 NitT/TauT family transport system substrate-binding protein [Actinacidiphila yanglinensis]
MTLKKLVSETSSPIFSLPYFVARDEGYFAEEGLDVELVRKGQRDVVIKPVEDHHLISAFTAKSSFEDGEASLYRACEWGQIRRSYDSGRGGQVVSKRAAIGSQAIYVRPDDPANHPQDLANRTVAVNFHHGSHYIGIQTLEGFLRKEEINVVHVGGPKERFEALRDGKVEAAAVMEPWITVAEKLGYKLIAEAYYVGAEIADPNLDPETFTAIQRAVIKAVHKINEDPKPYLHYLIADVPEEIVHLDPSDFRRDRLRYAEPAPYPAEEFQRTYDWMVAWDLIPEDADFTQIVDNRLQLAI